LAHSSHNPAIGTRRSVAHSLMTDRLSATMQIAKRLYTLAQKRNDTLLLIGADGALACTLYCLGDIETSGRYAMLLAFSSGARSGRILNQAAPSPRVSVSR
jgi:hypothetical protein